jgi:hypothetical protein
MANAAPKRSGTHNIQVQVTAEALYRRHGSAHAPNSKRASAPTVPGEDTPDKDAQDLAQPAYVRLAASLVTLEPDVERTLAAVRAL